MSRAEPPRPTWFVLPGRGVTPGAVIGMGAALLAAGNRGAEDGRVWDLNDATGAFAPADPLRAPERWWARLYAVDGGAGVVPDPRGLAGYPGVEDALVLAELLDSAVVLTGGGPAGLRRLRAGGDLADLVDALWPPYRRLTAIGGGSAEERAVGSATQALVETARAVDAAMTDATRVRLHLVAEPTDARRLAAAAALLGFSGLSASTPAGAVVPLADNAVTTDLRPTGGTGLDARYRFTVRLPVTE